MGDSAQMNMWLHETVLQKLCRQRRQRAEGAPRLNPAVADRRRGSERRPRRPIHLPPGARTRAGGRRMQGPSGSRPPPRPRPGGIAHGRPACARSRWRNPRAAQSAHKAQPCAPGCQSPVITASAKR
jgi:hypothetical protein